MSIVSSIMDILSQAMQPTKLLGAAVGGVGQILAMYILDYLNIPIAGGSMGIIITNMLGQLILGNVIELMISYSGLMPM